MFNTSILPKTRLALSCDQALLSFSWVSRFPAGKANRKVSHLGQFGYCTCAHELRTVANRTMIIPLRLRFLGVDILTRSRQIGNFCFEKKVDVSAKKVDGKLFTFFGIKLYVITTCKCLNVRLYGSQVQFPWLLDHPQIVTLGTQFRRRSFTKTTKGIGSNLVPCGIPPLTCSDADEDDSKQKKTEIYPVKNRQPT